jgi:HNH endonuclease
MAHLPVWVWLAAFVYFGPKLYYAIQVGRRRKGEIGFRLRRVAVGLAGYVGGILVTTRLGYSAIEAAIFSFVLAIAAGFFFVHRPPRRRVLPKRVRQAVIARDLKGARFDATIHHIDHIVPFSKGGDNSETNLRVIPKKENLSRGARMPKMRDFRKNKI